MYALADRNGAVIRTNNYDVYGARTSAGTGPQLAKGFTGREHDESGLNYHRDRYLLPGQGRWTQADRLGMVDGPNLFAYVASNPTTATDPEGKFLSMAMARPLGVVAGAAWIVAGFMYVNLAFEFEPFDDLFFGLGMGYIIGGITIIAISATCRAQVTKNRATGNAFRDEMAEWFRSNGYGVRTEVYKRTPLGKRFIDIEVSWNGRVLGGIETKAGRSAYTTAQRFKDLWLGKVEGYWVNVLRGPL